MKLIVGLGNPGPQYAHTRHNLGFMVINELAHHLEASAWKLEPKFKAELTRGNDILLAKPQTFMNLSGEAVQRIMQYYKLAPEDIWIIADELDLPFGRLRIRIDGSSGGHQGLNSIIQHIGPNFIRVRLGISLNDRAHQASEDYVLQPFNPDEQAHLAELTNHAAAIIANQLHKPAPETSTLTLLNSAPAS